MKNTAFLYAGQGSQHVGMGVDLYEKYPTFAKTVNKAQTLLDFELLQLFKEGPEEKLSRTLYTQPCMAVFAAGVTEILYENDIKPLALAGLSLGEYSALYAAGCMNLETLIPLMSFRAKAMETACDGIKCGMSAVLGLNRDKLSDICNEVKEVSIANYNCPGQLVIAGKAEAVDKAGELAKEAGAKRCLPLNVSGAFHTKLMAPAAKQLENYFINIEFSDAKIPVYHNLTAKPISVGDSLKDVLQQQVMSSVFMQDIIENMVSDGIERFIEIGPGKALSGFVKKTAPGVECYSIDSAEDLEKVIAIFKEEQ